MRRATWPLFWCLSAKARTELEHHYEAKYGHPLEMPSLPSNIRIDAAVESVEEIDRLMRQKPHHPRRVT